jgi:cellulose synthase/poly-beta-1,6-N-acetylglucosamine synthase-like glycosyltransferase
MNGFDETCVCEDLALALDLMEAGYECKYVDVISYEGTPETVRSYMVRYIRWAKGTLEVVRKGTRNISFTANFNLFMTLFSYLIYILLLPGMFLVTWGYSSTVEDLILILNLILTGKFIFTPLFAPLILISFYVIIFLLMKIPLAYKLHISLKDYILGLFVIPAIDFYMLLPLIKGLLETLMGQKVVFTVTDKSPRHSTNDTRFSHTNYYLPLWILLIIGVMQNPLSFVFNFFWLVPFLLTPFILYLIQKK